jgi:hypothetical protein
VNYKMSETNDNCFSVHETMTGEIIKTFNSKESAKKLMRHLNFGGGFDSWTPSFFLRDISNYINNPRKDNK